MTAEFFLQICGYALIGSATILLSSLAILKALFGYLRGTNELFRWQLENKGSDAVRHWLLWKKRRDDRFERMWGKKP